MRAATSIGNSCLLPTPRRQVAVNWDYTRAISCCGKDICLCRGKVSVEILSCLALRPARPGLHFGRSSSFDPDLPDFVYAQAREPQRAHDFGLPTWPQTHRIHRNMNRRNFLLQTAAAGLALAAQPLRAAAQPPPIATNTYPWGTFAQRDGGTFTLHTDQALAAIASAGLTGYEPIINTPEELTGLGARLKAHGLEMRSLYVNSSLHDPDAASASIDGVLAIARRATDLGTSVIVTNPSPIRWGGPENKTDAQLLTQAKALDRLGAELRKVGATLAYHNHDAELRLGAREFHHMLTATDPAHVKLCLDAHWIFRGCGNSQVALFDALEHYGNRIVELHLRQSRGGVWTEVFTSEGDIDYARLSAWLKQHGVKPRLVLEQAVETGSPKTLEAVAAHQQGQANARRLFDWMA